VMLVFTGIAHLTFLRAEFKAQVPPWVPFGIDTVVVLSGIAELVLGLSLLTAPKKYRPMVGLLAVLFFIVIFPGNIAQYIDHRSAFGLDTDTKRLLRLFFQPVFIYWAWWSTRTKHNNN
jgi:uncharacterized membrane protein